MSKGYPSPASAQPLSPSSSPGAKLVLHLHDAHTQSMDGRQSDYQQPGLSPPFPAISSKVQAKRSSADQTSAAQYPQGQDPRNANFSSSATPTSDYGIAPSSARSGSFPDYIQRSQYPPTGQGASAGGMAQATSPSIPLHNDQAINHNGSANKSDPDVPIDPSIAAASPTYPQHHPYSPYTPGEAQPMYGQHPAHFARPDWPPGHYQTPPHMPSPYGQPVTTGPPTPAMVSPVQRPPTGGHPLSTVYSFVPIPGAQQHKRPRRRYEEIERMYKCGWNGCEKAYGTLNHLNAHVTMQSHGSKRTPEEFKEIRKEWKAKKKEEEAARKAEEERQRQQAEQQRGPDNQSDQPVYGQHMRTPIGPPPSMGGPQLPPIGYAPNAGGQSQPQYPQQSSAMEGMAHYPQSPYGQNNQMYPQQDNGQPFHQ